jgi:ElaB/YqjD/DUF883 family membrane-anchored ribosome-binding protein
MAKQKLYNAEQELNGLIQMLEHLFALEDKLENAGNSTSGIRHNIEMQKRDLKTAIAQLKLLQRQQIKPKHTQPVYGTQGWLYR